MADLPLLRCLMFSFNTNITLELTSDMDSISESDTHASLETEASVKLMTLH